MSAFASADLQALPRLSPDETQCAIGVTRDIGVTGKSGRVSDFRRATSFTIHEGLYVVDEAAMPGPLGVRPMLMITARGLNAPRQTVEA
jgi:hypothetical protein